MTTPSPTAAGSGGLVDALSVAVATLSPDDGTVLYANPALGELLGVPVADVVGGTIDAALGEEGVLAVLAASAADDEPGEEIEVRGRCPDGRPLWVLVSSQRVAPDGLHDVLLVSFRDASLRRRLERELARTAEFPSMNPDAVCRMTDDGTVVLANPRAKALFGARELDGGRWHDLCPGMDDETWERVLQTAPVELEAEVGGEVILFRYVRSDFGDVFVYGADITARRLAERQVAEQAAALAEMARFPEMNPGPTLRIDLEGRVRLANAAAREVFGDDIAGRHWGEIFPVEGRPDWSDVVDASDLVPVETRIGDRDFVFKHRRDHEGGLVFVYGTDITTLKQAELALVQSEKMATLGTLVAGVAHELNNPAAATRRAAEHLRDELAWLERARFELEGAGLTDEAKEELRALEERAREAAERPGDLDPLDRADREAGLEDRLEELGVPDGYELAPSLVAQGLEPADVDRLAGTLGGPALAPALAWLAHAFPVYSLVYEIGEGSTRISEIVGALKSYSYLGQAPLQEIDLHEGLDNTLVILRNKLKAGIAVEREYCTDMPPISAYGSELNQVWTNLIDNAVDAMGGEGRLTIRTRTEDGWAVVEVEDEGPGIPQEVQGKVFDPFFTTKEPGRGTGLGLSTSYAIVTEKHGGKLTVDSRPGRTRFTVRLPAGRDS